MKKVILISSMLLIALVSFSFIFPKDSAHQSTSDLKWYSWEEAIEANRKQPKKLFVDVYTDWCGWCKRMDKNTFQDPKVANYLQEHFYPIKLDAEMKDDVEYKGNTFQYVASGRRGVHTLAYSLLDGKLSYPTVVYLNEKEERISISPGYKGPEDFLTELKWVVQEQYAQGVSLQEFKKQQN